MEAYAAMNGPEQKPGTAGGVEHQALYRAVNAAKVLLELKPDGIIRLANEKLAKLIGVDLGDLKGKAFSAFLDERFAESDSYQEIWRQIALGKDGATECHLRNKNGVPVWLNASFHPETSGSGEVSSVLVIADDITDLKAELQARMAIMDLTSIVSEANLKGDIVTHNARYVEVSQYSTEELIGKPHSTTRHPDMPKETFKQLWATIGRGQMFRGVIKNRKKDGTPYYVDAVIAPILGSNGKPRKYLGARYDITELELERHNMKGILGAIDAAFTYVEFDLTGGVMQANGKFQSALGYSAEEIKGKHHRAFVDSEYAGSAAYAKFWEELKGCNTQYGLFKCVAKDGRDVWLQAVHAPVRNEVGQLVKFVMIGINVTAEKKTQAEVENMVTSLSAAFLAQSKDISARSNGVAKGAQTLGSTTEEMNASIEELTASVNSIAQNSKNADGMAKSCHQDAGAGAKAIEKAIESMDLIAKSSEDISEIVKVISEIANQTNLLAFNAAIEAARAGEHGLGFSVVAGEVRKLAERSSQATKEISKLINESVKRVTQGNETSKQAGAAFTKILDGVNKTSQAISEVNCAAEEQLVAAKEISSAIQSVAQETEKFAAASEGIAKATQDLTSGSEELNKVVARFKS